jgi:hypothetical protein
MLKKIIVSACLSMFLPILAQEKAEQALKIFEERYPQEKIHLLFDKKSYLAGENIWFKSFVFTGFIPSPISTNLFIELYDSKKILLDKKLIPLINGEGNGHFTLSENLKENIYYIRAYTTWSTNFSEEFQTIRSIEIYNPSSPEKLIVDNISPWNISVHPESGTFINTINTKFAVRLHSKGQKPSNWSGYVTEISAPATKITTFKGFDENVGSFRITPELGKRYQLTIEDDKGKHQTIPLPDVISSGINLQIENSSEAIKYSIVSKNIDIERKLYTIIGTINDQIVYKAKLNNPSDKIYTIPTEKLVNGILTLNVFDDKDNLLSQRMCFVRPEYINTKQAKLSNISLNNSNRSYNSFIIENNIGNPSFSILITDGESESSEDENSLLSTLLLTGDINSDIDSPAKYMKNTANPQALDALLISEKWKRFDWKAILSGNFPIIRNKPETYISYKGKVSILGKPAENTDLNIIFSNENKGTTKFLPVKTDHFGFFYLNGLMFEDSMTFSYQLNDKKIPKEQLQLILQPNYSFVPLKQDFRKLIIFCNLVPKKINYLQRSKSI